MEGWLIDSSDHWIWRFHRVNSAWVKEPKVFIDRGRQMPYVPPRLKERRYLRKDAEEQLWKSLHTWDGGRRNLYGEIPWNPEIVLIRKRFGADQSREGMVLSLSKCSQVVSGSPIWIANERSLFLGRM